MLLLLMSNRDLKHVIYTLKRRNGRKTVLHQRDVDAGSVNYVTGAQTYTTTTTVVRRAIVLPVSYRLQQRFMLFASNFKYGGDYKIGDREFIIDKSDVSGDINLDDYLAYNGKRFDILDIMNLDNVAYHLLTRSSNEEYPQQVIDVLYVESLDFTETFTNE